MAGLYSCQSPNGGGGDFLYRINLDEAKTIDFLSISELCDQAETIILETTENSLLTGIEKLIRTNERLYIFDRRNVTGGSVTEFDMYGRFVKRYGRIGRGPGEYTSLSDFTIDEQNGIMYLLDFQTGRIVSYDLDSGQHIGTMRIDQNGMRSATIIPVGNFIYSDLIYREYDESNYLLRSWNKTDPAIENYYLPVGKYLKGWSNISEISNNKFIYQNGNNYALFSNKYSPEIFKLTPSGISNYIYIESKHFIDQKGRQVVSNAQNNYTPPTFSERSPDEILSGLDRFNGVRNYFETKRYICFLLVHGKSYSFFLYDKSNGITQKTKYSSDIDMIVKKEHPEGRAPFRTLPPGSKSMFFYVPSQMIPRLRTAAQEGMLVDDLDRLEELKQLPDDSNPVIFYMKFKEPMQ